MEESSFFEIISSCEYHGWKQSIEEDFFIEIEMVEVIDEVHNKSEDEADYYSNSSLMYDVDLSIEKDGTFLC